MLRMDIKQDLWKIVIDAFYQDRKCAYNNKKMQSQ